MRRFLFVLLAAVCVYAETGYDAWLRYAPLGAAAAGQYRSALPAVIVPLGRSELVGSARQELLRGLHGMIGRTLRVEGQLPKENAIVLGTLDELRRSASPLPLAGTLAQDGYWLKTIQSGNLRYTVVAGANDRGVLYGSFALLRKIATKETVDALDEKQEPYNQIRWLNHWDNLNGSIERGYGGPSIFWEKDHVREDLSRVSDYARLLASVGINACSINNVNADKRLLTPEYLPQIARIAAAFRPWGVRIAMSIDFASPQSVGGLKTFDPLDPEVAAWWRAKVDEIYGAVPDMAGIVIKADSEGRVGPSAYGRTHADAANVVARALKPHAGLIFYRGFVYDHRMDWRNLKLDRARAADDNFRSLDGKFDDNVVIQIKHGPIDFQVREPASPLFGTLERTNEAIELQITQEYFGQGRFTVFLVPMWKEALDFDLHAASGATPVKALAAGKVFHRPTGGFVGVANVGMDENWMNNHHSMANLYGFGRLAWNPDLSAQKISDEWTRQTWGDDPAVLETVNDIELGSWRAFENYTGNLGLQTLTDIVGNHYGVSVEASERNGWGQWHRSDDKGAGMDRTVTTGTGFIGQYRPPVAKMYESLESCPDDLLLFMHHVPYTYKLHSGETVIQHIYDAHFQGAETFDGYVRGWKTLVGKIDERRYRDVLAQLEYQSGQVQVWRDAVTNWYRRASGIEDVQGRVGHYPGRFEAEAMKLDGYAEKDVIPWEGGSGGKAVSCPAAQCKATLKYNGAAGWYTLNVRYFDQNSGRAKYRVFIGNQLVEEWIADDWVPTARIDSASSARRLVHGVALRAGDKILVEGVPDGGETAALDYIEIWPEAR
jgi:alpha-glucuronidase